MTRNSRNPRHRRRIELNNLKRLKRSLLIGFAIVFAVLAIVAYCLISNRKRNNYENGDSATEAYDVASDNGENSEVVQKDKVSFVLTALR